MKADISIIDAIDDPNLLGSYLADDGDLSTWRNWLTFLRVLYGRETSPGEAELIEQATGRDASTMPQDGFIETLLLCGRRSGKSRMTGLVGAFEAVFGGRHKLTSNGEIPLVLIASPTKNQSRIVHSYMRAVFNSPILSREVESEERGGFKLKNGVEIAIAAGDPKTIRGFTLIAAVVDEIAMFGLSEESKVRSDSELIRSLRPALATTGGRLLAIGTPFAPKGHAYKSFRAGYGNAESDILVWNSPSTVMNPTLPQSVVDRAVAEDETAARVEYCVETGLFREDVDNFISRATVEGLVVPNRKELPPRRGVNYGAFADVSGGRVDDAALGIAHLDGDVVVIDLIERHKAPHSPDHIVSKMCSTLKRYGVKTCVGDCYSAEWTRQAFARNGIDYKHSSRSEWNEGASQKNRVKKSASQLYAELLPRLNSGEIELPDDETLIHQLSSLQRRPRSGGRDSISHPPGAHDDVANVCAGVADVVSQRQVTIGGCVFGPHGGDDGRITRSRQMLNAVAAFNRSTNSPVPFDPFS